MMTREDQLKCIEDNCDAFKRALLAKASKMPPNWDGMEIRQWAMDCAKDAWVSRWTRHGCTGTGWQGSFTACERSNTSIAAFLARDLLRAAAEDPDENVIGQIDRFIDGIARWHHADIDLLFACKSYAGDEARPEIDHAPVDARHVL
jgi:hypothetical protein